MTFHLSGVDRRLRGAIMLFAVPVAFVFIMILLYPHVDRFEFDTDEGINLMKAMLLSQGYPLYREIWSDQPPLLTYGLAVAFHFFGFDVNVGRFFVLLLSGMLLMGLWQFLQTIGGRDYAITGCFLTILLPYYLRLSISAMTGLPAISFALVSLWLLSYWHTRRNLIWLFLSACTLSLSVLTKLFTAFLFPIFLLGIIVAELSRKESHGWKRKLWPGMLWALTFIGTAGIIVILTVDITYIPQLLTTHLYARTVPELQRFTLQRLLDNLHSLLFLALLGSLLMVYRRQWLALYPLSWAACAYVVLMNHAPVWSHHQFLLTIPGVILGACGIGEVIRWLPGFYNKRNFVSGRGLISVIVGIGVIFFVLDRLPKIPNQFNRNPSYAVQNSEQPQLGYQDRILSKMARYAPVTRWVVTDSPMYAFRSGLLVPPNLAVTSWKRIKAGELTEQEVVDTIQKRNPEQVLIARFEWPAVEQYLRGRYQIIYAESGKKLFLRNDIM